MSKKTFSLLFVLILIIATSLRLYKLAQIPHGMTWDEAAIGYTGFAIFNTRRDEWLHRLPISFMSFGDYKAPLAIYLNGFFTAIFGMNLWAVRLPFTLASITAIAGMMLLTEKISQKNKRNQRKWALVAGAIMTFSPWHIHYSRAGFESGMSLAFFIWSLYFLFLYIKAKQKKLWSLGLAVILAVASIYTYHSAKIVVPLVMLILVIWHGKKVFKKAWQAIFAGGLGLVLVLPMIWDSFKGQGLERLGTTILDEFSGLELILTIFKQFFAHLSPAFLIMGKTTTLRHGDGAWGILLPTTFIFVILGIIFGAIFTVRCFKKKKINKDIFYLFYLGMLLAVVGIIPAALGEEIPHSNRALLALPGFILLAVFGLKSFINQIKKSEIKKSVVGTLVLVHLLFFIAYISSYFSIFAVKSASDFKDGYLEAFEYIVPYEEQVEKILFTSDYGQPYIYALFVRQTNPIWYRGGSLIKYEFKDEINVGDLIRENTIVVASNRDELEPGLADYLVYGSDEEIKFKIYLPRDK
ncbi:glycosyltransferase family 39 protein [Patescibacteria group bacterium]|nr:glycosyltransferase family 39 protein [Patescibacteria group bacterium]MBU1885441.1 glycosyltransferase family 39 protein [Patescibacteria group bacterium]